MPSRRTIIISHRSSINGTAERRLKIFTSLSTSRRLQCCEWWRQRFVASSVARAAGGVGVCPVGSAPGQLLASLTDAPVEYVSYTVDVVHGRVIKREGDVLTVRSATLVCGEGALTFNHTVLVTLGAQTRMRRQISHDSFNKDDIIGCQDCIEPATHRWQVDDPI